MVFDASDVGVGHQLWVELVSFNADARDGVDLGHGIDDAQRVHGGRQRAGFAASVVEARSPVAQLAASVRAVLPATGHGGLDVEGAVLEFDGG